MTAELAAEVPRGPRRRDARANRQRVLQVALEVFNEVGPDAQMEDIARRAGVGVATIYRNFESKDDLLRVLAEDVASSLRDEAVAAATEADPWVAFERVVRSFASVNLEYRVLINAARALPSTIPAAPPSFGDTTAAVDRVVQRAIDAGLVRADLRPRDLGALATVVGALPDGPESRDDAERLVQVVLEGMRARPGDAQPAPRITSARGKPRR